MNRRDIGFGLIVMIFWGLNYLAIKFGVSNIQPLVLLTIRFIFVAIPAIFILPRPPISWKWLIGIGLVLYLGQFVFLFSGIRYGMPTGLSSIVTQGQVFFTLAFAAIVLKEPLKGNHIIGLLIAFSGIIIVGMQQGGNMTAVGFWLTLGAAACWGIGNGMMRKATSGIPPFSMLSLVVWASAVAILPLIVLSLWLEGLNAWKEAVSTINWVSIGSIIYLAYCASFIGYGLWGTLLSRYPAATVAPFTLLLPVIAMSSSALVLKETFSFWQITGALFIMMGLMVNIFGDRLEKNRNHHNIEI